MKILHNPNFWLILILLIAAVVRFFSLEDYIQFLGDQGRDVLVVKRMLVDGKFTLLGPNASVGGFFTGPIYYYLMLPFLFFFQLDPVGPAVLAVFFGLATIVGIYYFCRVFFNDRVALLAAFLATISPKMVDISRYSWNPNPVPFFTILTVLFVFLAKKFSQLRYTFLAGISLGIMYELHYIDLAFVPITVLMLIFLFPSRKVLPHLVILAFGWVIGVFPFLLFELKHNFPNTRSVFEFVTRGGNTVAPRDTNLARLILEILRRDYEAVLNIGYPVLNLILFSSLGALGLWVFKNIKDRHARFKVWPILIWVFLGALGIGLYKGELHDHYFIYLFCVPLVLIALLGSYLTKQKFLAPIFIAIFTAIIYFEIMNLYFWNPPNMMLTQTKQISQTVLTLAGEQPYNFALIASRNSDHAYRYFLEIWGRQPVTIENPDIDPMRNTVTQQLIVICEDDECKPLGHPLWEIAGFGQAEIAQVIDGPAGIKILKLVHYKGS